MRTYDGYFGTQFVEDLIEALLLVDSQEVGFAIKALDKIAAISGRERDQRDYDQLLQILAELHIQRQVCSFCWPTGTVFEFEPHSSASGKNPEMTIRTQLAYAGLEVKCPELTAYAGSRADHDVQAPSRALELTHLQDTFDTVQLPKDNPVKDFLISANAKFEGFKTDDRLFYGVLVIFWDDFIQEPVTALMHPAAGLLTANSFHSVDDQAVRYPYIDAIVLVRHLLQFRKSLEDRPFADNCRSTFDYGTQATFPPKVVIRVSKRPMPNEIAECLQVVDISEVNMYADYRPQDLIIWLSSP